MAVVAEISPFLILAQQVLLCSGDGSPSFDLQREQGKADMHAYLGSVMKELRVFQCMCNVKLDILTYVHN